MPLRTDKIYNRDTDQNIDTINLVKYNPSDNTIRTLLDQILINLNDLEGLNAKELDLYLEEWNKKITDIENEYNKIITLLNELADPSLLKEYKEELQNINDKITQLEKTFDDKIAELEKEIQNINQELDSSENKIEKEIQNLQDEINNLTKPKIKEQIKKILIIGDFTQKLLNNRVYTYTSDVLSKQKNSTFNIKISRYVIESGNTYLHYCFTDTETTNYFKFINPITGEEKQYNDCGDSSGGNWSCCDYHNQDLRFLLNGQNDDIITVKITVTQNDYPGFGYIKMWDENHPYDEIYIHNSKSKIINYKEISDFQNNFEAVSVCDMFNNNYPLPNSHKYVVKQVGDMIPGRYVIGHNPSAFNTSDYLWFKINDLESKKYEVGILTYDLEDSEEFKCWLEFNTDNIQINPLKASFENLKNVTFPSDDKNYMIGNGNIKIQIDEPIEGNFSFIVGSFASVDLAPQDYVKIITENSEEIMFSVPSYPSIKNQYKVYSNNSRYEANIELIESYNTQLPGQEKFNSTQIYKIIIKNIKKDNLTIQLHTNQSFSDEVLGYQVGSETFKNNSTMFDIIGNKEVKSVNELKTITTGLPSQRYKFLKFNIDLTNYSGVYNVYLYMDSPNGYANIFDFYLREIDYDKIYEFKTDKNELINIIPYFSSSKLPLTWSGTVDGFEFWSLPNKNYITEDYTAYVKWKPYKQTYYKISFDVILSGSWDNEEYKIMFNNKTLFKDYVQFPKYDKALNYKIHNVNFQSLGAKLSDWENGSVLSNGTDAIGHFEYTLLANNINMLQFYNSLNENINNEMMSIANISIEQTDYNLNFLSNYSNKWKDLSGFTEKNIVATDQVQLLVFNGKNTLTLNPKLDKKLQYLRIIAWNINTIDENDYFKVFINDEQVFGNTLSSADSDIHNCLNKNFTKKFITVAESDKYNLTINKINEIGDINRYNAINGKNSIRFIIDIPFYSTGNDNIKIELYSNQPLNDEAYGIESIEIYDKNEVAFPVLTDNITNVISGSSNDWKQYTDNGIYVDIDTSKYGLENPVYFTSLSGISDHWLTTGATSLYNVSNKGFRVYIHYPDKNIMETAKNYKWTLHWIAFDRPKVSN